MSHNCSPFTTIIMKLHTKTPHEVRMCPMDFEVKCQGHNALITENGLCCIIALPFHLLSWNFIQRLPMSRGCALRVSGSKGQRSRSHCIDYLKWLLVYNCFPFTSAFIELHTQIPSESRICPNDIGIKAWRVWIRKIWLPGGGGGYFVPLGQHHSSWNILNWLILGFSVTFRKKCVYNMLIHISYKNRDIMGQVISYMTCPIISLFLEK